MKLKSLSYKAALAASALAFVTCFPACSNDSGTPTKKNTASAPTVAEHMKITVEEFINGEKQFAMRGNLVGSIRVTGNASWVDPDGKRAGGIPGVIEANGENDLVVVPVNMMLTIPSESSNATLRISFYHVDELGIEEVFRVMGVRQEEIRDIINVDEMEEDATDRDTYDYVVTVTYNPLTELFSSYCQNLALGTVVPDASGSYFIEKHGTPVTPVLPPNN